MMATSAKQPPGIAAQAFWLTASKFIAVLLNMGLPILLVRLMSRAEYGIYKEAFLFVGTAANIATFGVGMSAFYFIPRHPERGGQVALNILVYNFIAGWVPLLILAFYPQLLTHLFRTSALEPLAILLGILVLFTLTSSLLLQIPTALQDVKYSTAFIVGSQLARAIMIAAAALIFRSIESLIIATILNQLLSMVVLFWYLHDRFPRFWTHFDWSFFKEQLAYALPYGAFGLLWVIQKDLDNYFVGALLGPSDFAIYAVGWVDVPLISLVFESLVSVLIVRVSTLQRENRKADIRYITAAATNRLSAMQLPLFMFLLVAGHDLIVLLYTKAYERSTNIFLVTIILLPFSIFLSDPIVRAYKDLRNFVLGVRLGIFIGLFCVLFPVIRHFGMMGAVLAAVAAQLLERIFLWWKVIKTVEATTKDLVLYGATFKIACVTIAAGLVAYLVRNTINPDLLIPRIAAVLVCIGVIYVTATYIFKLPGSEMLSKERIVSLVRTTWARMRHA